MKFSEKWLREWVNPSLSTDELVEQLTMAGLEVDAVEPVAGNFSGVVVGEIVKVEPHPDADKLRVCQVAGHPEGEQQVVCGAANAREGLKIPFALVGAELPPPKNNESKSEKGEPKPFKIKKAKLRGVESSGMLCAEQELGMADSSDGLMELAADAPVGEDIRTYLDLDDSLIEVDLTPNRADCLSIRGVAREVGVLNQIAVNEPAIEPVPAVNDDMFPVELAAPENCSRYAGRVIRNVDVSKPTPLWMVEKLRRSGIRSIDPIVDITNYVLLELGQPMHAFDINKLQGKVKVRMAAEKGEKITLLDGQEVELKADSLVIADESGPVALAGIMGGADTAVSSETKDIFLESAFFDPIAIAGKARGYGLHTDSSHRFERGVDHKLQDVAVERATQLILEVTGGEPGPTVLVEEADHLPKHNHVILRPEKIEQYLGVSLDSSEVTESLNRLGMEARPVESGWMVASPSWRFDIEIEVDLLEEIARIYGYNNLPTTSILANLSLQPVSEADLPRDKVLQRLCALGYSEVITYSFVDSGLLKKLQPTVSTISLQNPISADMATMRTSLLPGLLSTALYNINRQQSRVRIFETGLIFTGDNQNIEQEPRLGLLLYGAEQPESWSGNNAQLIDFYDIKGDLEAVLELTGGLSDVKFEAGGPEALHPGQSARIIKNDEEIGAVGALHPAIQADLGFDQPVFVAEISLSALEVASVPVFSPLSRYPEVRRDIAVIVDEGLPVAELCTVVSSVAGAYLENLKVFDVYSGEGIEKHRKSVALGLTFRAESRTLTELEINDFVGVVVTALESQFNAVLRN